MEFHAVLWCQACSRETTATALKPARGYSWPKKKTMHFQSHGERNKVIHCPPYCSTQYYNIYWKTIWSGGRKNEKSIRLSDKTEDCLTNLRFSDDVWHFSTSLENHVKCSVSSRPAQRLWVWASTRTRRRYSATRTEQRRKKLKLTTSKSKSLAKRDSARFFGQKITFEEQETEEIKNKLKAAWARSTKIVKS